MPRLSETGIRVHFKSWYDLMLFGLASFEHEDLRIFVSYDVCVCNMCTCWWKLYDVQNWCGWSRGLFQQTIKACCITISNGHPQHVSHKKPGLGWQSTRSFFGEALGQGRKNAQTQTWMKNVFVNFVICLKMKFWPKVSKKKRMFFVIVGFLVESGSPKTTLKLSFALSQVSCTKSFFSR